MTEQEIKEKLEKLCDQWWEREFPKLYKEYADQIKYGDVFMFLESSKEVSKERVEEVRKMYEGRWDF